MRLLFCSRPAYGHLYPMMPLALAARAAGHEVAFATGGRFVAMLRALGFAAVGVGISSAEGRAELLGGADDAMPRGADGARTSSWRRGCSSRCWAGVRRPTWRRGSGRSPPTAQLAVRPTPWSEPGAALPGWVAERRRRPLVYLTLGTVVGTAGDLAPAIAALATLDADVLVALGSAAPGSLEHVPANVHVDAFVDQAAVLRHADLVVHHGGSGTVLGALAHARRQLLLPKGADQFLNADALSASGMAQVLEPAAATEQAIAAAARAALAAPVPAAVLGARAEIAAMPAPDAALAALLDRLAVHR